MPEQSISWRKPTSFLILSTAKSSPALAVGSMISALARSTVHLPDETTCRAVTTRPPPIYEPVPIHLPQSIRAMVLLSTRYGVGSFVPGIVACAAGVQLATMQAIESSALRSITRPLCDCPCLRVLHHHEPNGGQHQRHGCLQFVGKDVQEIRRGRGVEHRIGEHHGADAV